VHDAALKFGLGKGELQQVVQMKSRAESRSLDECIAAVLELRPRIERRFIFVGAVTDPAIRHKLSEMSQGARDALLLDAVRTQYPGIGAFDGRMAVQRFTLGGDSQLSKSLQSNSVDFETLINQELGKKLGSG
jgi:hypothetical protein